MSLEMLLFNFCWSTILEGKINVHRKDPKPLLFSVWFGPSGSCLDGFSVIPEAAGFSGQSQSVSLSLSLPGGTRAKVGAVKGLWQHPEPGWEEP